MLVGGFNHLGKYEFVNGKDDNPYIMENKTCSKPPTRYPCLFYDGWWLTYPSEKYYIVEWDDEIPNIWKNKFHVPNISKPPTSMVLTGVSIWVYMEFLVLIIYWGTQLNLIPNTYIYIYIYMHMRHGQNMAYDGIWVYGHPSHNGNPYNEYFNPINGLTSIAQYGKLTHVLTTTCVWSFWRKHNMDFKTSLKWENRWSFTIPADQLQYWL